MENENLQNNKEVKDAERPITGHDAQFEQKSNTVSMDVGNGLSSGSNAVLNGVDVSEVALESMVPAYDTVPLTEAGAAMVTPYKGQGAGNDVPTDGSNAMPTTENAFMDYLDRRQAKPTRFSRGTNVIMPFGAEYVANLLGANAVTALNDSNLTTVFETMKNLVANIKTPGSFRELAHVRRIGDLKNTIVSYFNRSIPFTDLGLADRFAIEMSYLSDIGNVILPILGKYKAMAYVKHWRTSGFQYDESKLQNLMSQSLEVPLKSIYAAIANLPSVDDVFFKNITKHAKLYANATKQGFNATTIDQDVEIGRLGQYKLTNVSASSGYTVTTTGVSLSKETIASLTLNKWVEMWLRSDLYSVDYVAKCLYELANYAQSIRNNYQILLAAAQQLEQKGAVAYKRISSFLPVEGADDYVLKYAEPKTVFSYAYKERIEYAPKRADGEVADGTNTTFRVNLLDAMSEGQSYIGSEVFFRRPVGLYKAGNAWKTDEITEIGIFKDTNTNLAYISSIRALASFNSVAITNESKNLPTLYKDCYYGDVYFSAVEGAVADDSGITTVSNNTDFVQYYGIGNARNADYITYASAVKLEGLTAYTLVNGSQALDFVTYDTSAASAYAQITVNQLHALFEQLDLTLGLFKTANATGRISVPIFIFSGYRGAFFDKFDISIINNAFVNAYQSLVLPLKAKAQFAESSNVK